MNSIILERRFDPAISPDDFLGMAAEGAQCMPLYRVEWRESLMALDGERLLCRFEAPDTESVRMIARTPTLQQVAWAGSVHDSGRREAVTTVVERRFEEPADFDALQAQEESGAWCLEQHRVTFLRTFFSGDRQRMLCLYHAPDAESVRQAQLKAGMPVERVWACRDYNPDNFA